MKSIIPSKAHAKISSRIVPNQLSSDMLQKIADFLRSKAPLQVKVHVQFFPGGEPYRIDTNSPFFKAAAKAIESTYGKPPVLVHDGGTLPLCYLMEKELGIKSVLLGFGLPDDNLHSPNEKFDLSQFFKGILTILNFHGNLSENVIDKR
jgi:acetylornithine deacetylase/succinyl-diaminopimelate desuccinylase-like protein